MPTFADARASVGFFAGLGRAWNVAPGTRGNVGCRKAIFTVHASDEVNLDFGQTGRDGNVFLGALPWADLFVPVWSERPSERGARIALGPVSI